MVSADIPAATAPPARAQHLWEKKRHETKTKSKRDRDTELWKSHQLWNLKCFLPLTPLVVGGILARQLYQPCRSGSVRYVIITGWRLQSTCKLAPRCRCTHSWKTVYRFQRKDDNLHVGWENRVPEIKTTHVSHGHMGNGLYGNWSAYPSGSDVPFCPPNALWKNNGMKMIF